MYSKKHINEVLNILLNEKDNVAYFATLREELKNKQIEYTQTDEYDKLFKYTEATEFADGLYPSSRSPTLLTGLALNTQGFKMFNQHGSYLNYLAHLEKIKQEELIQKKWTLRDNFGSWSGGIAGIISLVISTILFVFTCNQNKIDVKTNDSTRTKIAKLDSQVVLLRLEIERQNKTLSKKDSLVVKMPK